MPLHIIKMTMIVIFVPSPPHLLLFSRVSLALPPPVLSSPPRLAVCPGHRHLHATSVRGPWERGRETLPSLSLSLSPPSGDGETRRDKEDSEIPSRPVYSLLSLDPAHRRARARARTRESLGLLLRLSRRVTLPHIARSFPVRPTNSPLSDQRFRAGLYLRRAVSFSACGGRLIAARLCQPTAGRYLCTSYTNGDNNRNFRWR